MRIGIDIDGVLTNVEEFEFDYASKYFYETEKLDSVKKSLSENFSIEQNDDDAFWAKAIYDYINIKPRNFADEIIHKLKEEGNKIYIITNRISDLAYCDINEEEMKDIVKKWLEVNDIYYDKLIFSNGDKTNFILDNHIDIMIEDNPKNITAISKLIPVLCYHANYNMMCNGKNIIRCYGWYDIYAEIKKI